MSWPDMERQPPGSWDCTFYAVAYLGRLLGYEWLDNGTKLTGKNVKAARQGAADPIATWPERVHGWDVRAAWHCMGMPFDARLKRSYSFAPAFREWVRGWTAQGCVGYAIIHRGDRGTHAVLVLEADDAGVLLADPITGVVRETWEIFESPLGDNRPGGKPTHLEAWYEVRASCAHNEACLRWIPELKMWERPCPCGLNAYGVTLPDLFRVWRRNAAVGSRVGR